MKKNIDRGYSIHRPKQKRRIGISPTVKLVASLFVIGLLWIFVSSPKVFHYFING